MAGLNNEEAHFLTAVSQGTGIDPRVVAAWMYEEGAFKKGGTGGYNYLNIRPSAGDGHTSVSSGGFAQFPDVDTAIGATLAVLHQSNMKIILTTAASKPTPGEQIRAIAASPWDANHYQGGKTLQTVIENFFGGSAVLGDKYQSPQNARAVANTVGSGSAADWTSYDAGNAAHDIASAITSPFASIEAFFKWIGGNWDRVLFVLGGVIIGIIALIFIVNSAKSNTFTFDRGDS